ncbi:DUF3127 domain-containing protein [bacterium]|nr:DUF3127 domain-containing protein [bacterium]
MSEAKVTGKVHVIEETKTFGQKGFRKRVVVLEQDNGRFPAYIPLEFIQDGCDTVDGMNVGDEVEVSYRLTGRKWQRDPQSEVKYFLSAEASSFRVLGGGSSGGDDIDYDAANAAFSEAAADEEDVPF